MEKLYADLIKCIIKTFMSHFLFHAAYSFRLKDYA